jgi:intron-binding protein aquarius
LDQSLFARFVRLGVRTVDLDAQGRARPALAKLYNWRYSRLGDLPATKGPQFTLANAGFAHECQVINVEDYEGQGETEPTPHFIQNLGEAEYVVAVFMYMRLIGYPAEKISILTTYNGQKNLIRDVIDRRCAWNPIFGRPAKISTVDRFQGQQNDFVLLSLVRTKTVGHLRDVRRLVVAMSRARFGLYIFCRQNLFANCYELTPTFSQFLGKPNKLQLVRETYPAARKGGQSVPSFEVQDVIHMGNIVAESDPSRRK